MTESFELTINIPADDWAYLNRRVDYLETLLLRIVRDRSQFQEWFSADELAALQLPGLPNTRAGISRKATMGKWPRRPSGINPRGPFLYHVTVLPARAFDALIARILDLPEIETETDGLFDLPVPPEPSAPLQASMPKNTAPAWVLPLMRLMKGEAQGNLGKAWQALPGHVPKGTALPSVREAAQILINLGLA